MATTETHNKLNITEPGAFLISDGNTSNTEALTRNKLDFLSSTALLSLGGNTTNTEALTRNELDLLQLKLVLDLEGDYDTYWQKFGEIYGGDVQKTAESNQIRQKALTTRLYSPDKSTGDRSVDSLSPAGVAKEWYMGIGSLNQLRGSSATMFLAAATLWESPNVAKLPDPKLVTRFMKDVDKIQRGQVPKGMRYALSNPTRLQYISLAGQVLLDIARIPEGEPINDRIFAAGLSLQIDQGLFKLLLEEPELSLNQKRVLSDSLKAEYDAKFELIRLKKSNDELSYRDYGFSYKQILLDQLRDTLRSSKKMTNGDLCEHYFVALMRYALNTSREQFSYGVMSATRRQDEPYDNFKSKNLPKFSFDAVVEEPNKKELILVQLKANQGTENMSYANGIIVVDNIFTPNALNTKVRYELVTGLTQMEGLLEQEVIGKIYTGNDHIIRQHMGRILQRLDL